MSNGAKKLKIESKHSTFGIFPHPMPKMSMQESKKNFLMNARYLSVAEEELAKAIEYYEEKGADWGCVFTQSVEPLLSES